MIEFEQPVDKRLALRVGPVSMPCALVAAAVSK